MFNVIGENVCGWPLSIITPILNKFKFIPTTAHKY